MRLRSLLSGPITAMSLVCAAQAQTFKLVEVPSVASLPIGQPAPQTIAFTDHKDDNLADKSNGLIRFDDWAHTRLAQKQFLGLYPSYDEPTLSPGGGVKPHKKRLHMYVAEGRFELKRSQASIDLSRYLNVAFLERLDPAIKHKLIAADDVISNKDPKLANHNPARRWCEGERTLCVQSRYQLEGRLPLGVALVNKLREGKRKIADYIEFQSELRVVPAAEIDQAGYRKLTGIDADVTGAFEQNIVQVNQVMQFGKFLAILQRYPSDPGKTIVTAFVALGVDSDLFEKKKELGDVPVLRNLVPAQVLSGNSSFNTGNSISAGLPKYSRNRLRAIAEILEKE
jgi:hypothetical protein